MIKILFVCHGNICRSPMAEFVMKDLVNKANMNDEFFIASAATHRDNIWNGQGSPMYRPAVACMQRHKVPFDDNKRAALLKKSDCEKYDYIIGMDKENWYFMRQILGGEGEDKIHLLLDFADGGEVADPWYTREFDTCYRDILKGCTALLEKL